MTGPYAQAAGDYWNAGWRGVLPLPPKRKANPPDGTTGNDGVDPSFPDVMAWAEDYADGNIALRLPEGVLGLDIDNYDTKPGKASLEAAERAWGALPATWRTTSRDDGVSGIRLYRVPKHADGGPLRWPGGFGPGTETIRRGHRYAVAPPSIHPEGRTYRWITPQGHVSLTPPRATELPWLPAAWVVGLTENRPAHSYQGAGMTDDDVKAWLQEHDHGSEMCGPMASAMEDTTAEMLAGAHESLRLLMRIVGLAAMGHDGLFAALSAIRGEFIAEVASRRDGGERTAAEEWTRSLFGAVDKVVGEMAKTGTTTSRIDPCEVLISLGEPVTAPPPTLELTAGDTVPDAELEDTPEADDQVEAALNAEQMWKAKVEKQVQDLRARQEAQRLLAIESAPPLTLLGIDEFLARPRPIPLVDGLLYRNSLSRIFGAPGCGKSFVAIDLALRMALGWSWGGSTVKQAKVVYVMAEGDAVNNERAHAWMDRHQVKAADLRGWFMAVPHKVLLLEEAVKPFIEAIKDQQVDLVILDTKNRMMLGNENVSEDNATMVRAVDTIREATGCCALLIDHTGLNATGRAKGDNATEGSMDTEAEVRNDHQHPPKVTVEVTRDKARELGATWEFFLRHHPIEIDGEVVPTAVVLPIGDDVELPAARMTSKQAETAWLEYDGPIPVEVLSYDGGEAVTRAMPDLARLMAHDAGMADANRIGVSLGDAVRALSETALGKGRGHSRGTVRRAWSAIRDLGYIVPVEAERADDPEKVAKAMEEKTTGKHVWARR